MEEGEIGLGRRRELTKVSEGDTTPGALSWPALAAQTESSPDPLPLPDPQVSCSKPQQWSSTGHLYQELRLQGGDSQQSVYAKWQATQVGVSCGASCQHQVDFSQPI